MSEEIKRIIKECSCVDTFDYVITPQQKDTMLLAEYIKELQQENQQLKEDFKRLRVTEILKENKLLKENKNFCEMINDKEWVDYKFEYENNQRVMKDLFKQLDLYKSILDEIREVVIELRNIIYNPDYEHFGLSREQYKDRFIHILQIIDKVKE